VALAWRPALAGRLALERRLVWAGRPALAGAGIDLDRDTAVEKVIAISLRDPQNVGDLFELLPV